MKSVMPSIRISKETKDALDELKLVKGETYHSVIVRLMESQNEKPKKNKQNPRRTK